MNKAVGTAFADQPGVAQGMVRLDRMRADGIKRRKLLHEAFKNIDNVLVFDDVTGGFEVNMWHLV